MGKFIDLTGQTFGKWTVICRSEDKISYDKSRPNGKKVAMWLCRCECGSERVLEGGALRRGKTKQCTNCVKPANYKDLTGERFGRLTVIKEEGRRGAGEVLWLCECDCGGTAIVSTSNLNRGNSTSCGCIGRELHKERCEQLHLEALERKAKARAEKERKKAAKREAKLLEQKKRKASFKAIKCKDCGKEITLPYSSRKRTCDECKAMRKKENNKINKRLREAKAKDNGKVDYSITLTKLIKRDNHICKLCRRKVNENDYVYVGDTFIAGNDYPSIDHIVPLSKGGVHQWNNVQLAHRLCNSIKCDKE